MREGHLRQVLEEPVAGAVVLSSGEASRHCGVRWSEGSFALSDTLWTAGPPLDFAKTSYNEGNPIYYMFPEFGWDFHIFHKVSLTVQDRFWLPRLFWGRLKGLPCYPGNDLENCAHSPETYVDVPPFAVWFFVWGGGVVVSGGWGTYCWVEFVYDC